jgi:hypothetical protein
MKGITRGTGYGYSLWEFQVFGLGTEQVTVPIPGGAHTWQIRATDGAGNIRTNSNGPLRLTSLTPFMQWQLQYFGSTTNAAAVPAADADGTGQNNLFKYVAGLNPTNPASVFVLRVNVVSNLLSVSFGPAMSNRLYTLQRSTNLLSGGWEPLAAIAGSPTNGNRVTLVDTIPTPSTRFYRVNISIP